MTVHCAGILESVNYLKEEAAISSLRVVGRNRAKRFTISEEAPLNVLLDDIE